MEHFLVVLHGVLIHLKVMNERKYVILNNSDVNNIDFSKVLETSSEALRYNNDKTKTFVKFEGDTPSFLSGKTVYTRNEILAILNDENGEWRTEED